MNKLLTQSFVIFSFVSLLITPVLGGRLVAERYEIRDLVPDPSFDQSGGAVTISDQKVHIGDLALVSGLPYSVGIRAQGDGDLLISLEPKNAGSDAVSLTVPLDDSKMTYAHRTFAAKSPGHVEEFALYLQSSTGKAIVDELHITPPSNLLRNGGFEERMKAHQDVHLDEDLQKFFSAVAPFWSPASGDLQAVLRENAGYGGSTGLSIEGGAGEIELTSSQIVLDSPPGPLMLGVWVNAPDGAKVEMTVRGHPLEVHRMTTDVRGLEYLSMQTELVRGTVSRISVSFRISKSTDKPVVLDDVQLMELALPESDLKVFVNQVGYEPGMPRRFMVATTVLTEDGVKYALRPAGGGKPLAEGTLECIGRVHEGRADDWGAFYWPGEFPGNIPDGEYVIEAKSKDMQAVSEAFRIGQSLLAEETSGLSVDFFWYQRCGMEIPGFHKVCHLDDARLPDGTHVEGWGGWHDAGDYNKYLGGGAYTGVAAFCVAYAAHDGPARFDETDRNGDGVPDALDEAAWGGDFLRRMLDPEGGMHSSVSTGYTFFGDPSLETDGGIG
ncbi:MAG TPA: glycoside hydrolase family 9 protein, partial [bacterium]|nr:glycoside hydrolase family 9 protein [bacterium]